MPKLLIPAIDRSVLFVKPPSLDYTHDETLPRGGDWSIALGPMNDAFFRELLDSMFVSVAQTRVETDGLVGAGEQALCLLYTSPSPRDRQKSRMPSSA